MNLFSWISKLFKKKKEQNVFVDRLKFSKQHGPVCVQYHKLDDLLSSIHDGCITDDEFYCITDILDDPIWILPSSLYNKTAKMNSLFDKLSSFIADINGPLNIDAEKIIEPQIFSVSVKFSLEGNVKHAFEIVAIPGIIHYVSSERM